MQVIYGQGASPPPGYVKISQDLNQGAAGGERVYLCYKKSSSEKPITGLNVFADSSSELPIQDGYSKVAGDLNKGTWWQTYLFVLHQRFEVASYHKDQCSCW